MHPVQFYLPYAFRMLLQPNSVCSTQAGTQIQIACAYRIEDTLVPSSKIVEGICCVIIFGSHQPGEICIKGILRRTSHCAVSGRFLPPFFLGGTQHPLHISSRIAGQDELLRAYQARARRTASSGVRTEVDQLLHVDSMVEGRFSPVR